MAKFGKWDVNIHVGGMPEKLATAFGDIKLVGAEYTPIAYLGSQLVNGVNHAVLAEQLVLAGKDTKNIVVMIFNEKADTFTLTGIERVVEGGAELGGTAVDVKTDIPAEAKEAFDSVVGKLVGVNVKPFALLATQVVKGVNYVFAAEVTKVTKEAEKEFAIVTVNALTNKVAFTGDLLTSDVEISLGKPLGEWP